jgi:hypothetical protein
VRARSAARRPGAAPRRVVLSRRFVPPASGRTVFHLASAVNLPLCAAELEAFAQAVGAGPKQQLVLVLDRAGWHTSTPLRVPDHLHLRFLPAYSPELNPAEQLWPRTNTALAHQHFKTLDDPGGGPSHPLRGVAGPAASHPLHHLLSLVAPPPPQTPTPSPKLV